MGFLVRFTEGLELGDVVTTNFGSARGMLLGRSEGVSEESLVGLLLGL